MYSHHIYMGKTFALGACIGLQCRYKQNFARRLWYLEPVERLPKLVRLFYGNETLPHIQRRRVPRGHTVRKHRRENQGLSKNKGHKEEQILRR